MSQEIVEAYRQAARKIYRISQREAEQAIVTPDNDPGEWAPDALAVIYLEFGDSMADQIGYFAPHGMDECFRLSDRAGSGYIEWINAAVAAVYE
jgi:hypothetical protein